MQQKDGSWLPGHVKEIHSDRSYTVETENGHNFKRNRVHLNDTREQFTLQQPENVKTTEIGNTENRRDQDKSVQQTRSGRIVKPPERWSPC